MLHAIWRRVWCPFFLPRCVQDCVWEVYYVQEACCLRCCARHVCATNVVDLTCPLFVNYDGSRSCPITGVGPALDKRVPGPRAAGGAVVPPAVLPAGCQVVLGQGLRALHRGLPAQGRVGLRV